MAQVALQIRLLSARGLREVAPELFARGAVQPYCLCEVMGRDEPSFRTRAVDEGDTPTWDESTEMVIEEGESLIFMVNYKDEGTEDDLIGWGKLEYDKMMPTGFVGELRLTDAAAINKAVRANTSYSLSPGVAKGPLKVVIGPVTLPQDPGEALLKGQVAIKNSKGEPVACMALDIDVPLAAVSSPQETRLTDEPSFCNKPTDHFKNASLTQSGEVTQLTGTLDEDLNAVVAHVDLTVQALFVKLPLKLAIPMSFTPAIPKGDWKLSFQEVSSTKEEEALGSPVKISGQIVIDDGKQEEVACLQVAAAGRDADIIV